MDASKQQLLRSLVRKEGRSLLQYVAESFPWTKPEDQGLVRRVLALAHVEGALLARLIRLLLKLRIGAPPLGAYPQSFTTINFMALDFLLPLLREDQKTRIADIEMLITQFPEGDVRSLLLELSHEKRKHLDFMNNFRHHGETASIAAHH
ncbi:MAG: hypothetical protein K2X38_15760 [Gemmataceae bacterium]|nr:hypothetical protein [Gemmataceae bacterium]